MPDEQRIAIRADTDIIDARQRGRTMALDLGFRSSDATLIATVISEVARNIVTYARAGEVQLTTLAERGLRGIRVIASDRGPGIRDLELAMRDGYSTSGSLGLGLPGSRRMMDEFHIASEPGQGTTITMKKWVR
jgi:serine/threonine-protein kinase RsbT